MIIRMVRMIILMGQDDGFPVQVRVTFFVPSASWPGLAPPSHGQISNWKRPLNFRKRNLGWGGVGWGWKAIILTH